MTETEKAIAEIWALFRESEKRFQKYQEENQKRFEQEEKKRQEEDKKRQEEDKKRQEEYDRRHAEFIASMQKSYEGLKENVGKLTDKWGRFLEYVLAPGIPKAFQDIDIPIHTVAQRVRGKKGNRHIEIDLVGRNDDYIVLVEVKSTLSVDDVREHLETIPLFKEFFPKDRDCKIIGAVAGIEITGESDKFAFRNGLYVLGQAQDTVIIRNSPGFQPKIW